MFAPSPIWAGMRELLLQLPVHGSTRGGLGLWGHVMSTPT